ncbi:cytochrome P450 87A3-like [Hibiscus syriacus]|uniref:cytochrome P450 87A3-like n=1 Tax=Hibiscus syriacus TaxID=106335 RepID=UPI00192444BD|nr:cytochrome P450 87A3-like [Hibiscus syriacus]
MIHAIMEIWYVWLFVISFIGVSVGKWIHRWRNPKCKGIPPPGSMGFPLIGETLSLFVTSKSIDIHPFLDERHKRYGPLFKTSLAGRPVVVSSDADFNYFVLQQEGKLIELYYMDSFTQMVHQDNMNNLGGSFHRYLRRSVLRHFGLEPLKRKLLSEFEDLISHELHEWTKQQEVDVKRRTVPMLFGLASQILMSHRPEENLGEDLNNMLQGVMRFPLYFPGTTFYNCIQKKRKALKLTSRLVEERMEWYDRSNYAEGYNKNGDFLDQIVGDIGKEAFLTKEFVPFLLFGLIIATVETISPAIALATLYLLDNPSILQQLTEEHEEILKKREDASSGLVWEEYKSMTFTHYVINETLRLENVLPGMLRKVIADIHVNGYTIPKGWILLVNSLAQHLNSDTYEDPLTFNPSRWKNIGSNTRAKHFIPCGGGNRPCAGTEFSKVLLAVYLHVWVTKFRMIKMKGGEVIRSPLLEFPDGFYVKVSEKNC